jgi:serine protease Do
MQDTTDKPTTDTSPKKTQPAKPQAGYRVNGGIGPIGRLLLTLVVGFFGGWLAVQAGDSPASTDITSGAGETVVLQESELISNIAEEVGQSVVSITVESEEQSFFGSFSSESAGTGIIISPDGVILTNKHVIPTNTTGLKIVMQDGTEYDDIEVIGRDPFTDIAFLKINGVSDLKPAELGDSSEVRVGQKVVAIGNALGEFSNTVTAGIISGLSRPIVAGDSFSSSGRESLQNLFQTDASINPGNSGGPLVNASGQVIGVNTAVAGNAENIGFAIPISDIIGTIETVLDSGELKKPYLGVRYVALNPDIAEILNIDIEEGAYLDSNVESGAAILPDSPADKAGLKEGDVIIRINETDVTRTNPLPSIVGRLKVGDEVTLVIVRDGQEQELTALLEEVPEDL